MLYLLTALSLGCTLGEPSAPENFTVDDGLVYFTFGIDPVFWACARAQELAEPKDSRTSRVETIVHLGDGASMEARRPEKLTRANVDVRTFRSNFCDHKPAPTKMQVEIRGTGAYAPLNMRSKILDVPWEMCERCGGKPEVEQKIEQLKKKDLVIDVHVNSAWHACAKRESTWSLRLYAAPDRDILMTLTKPWRVMRDLENRASLKTTVSTATLCKQGSRFVGYEIFATGSLYAASTHGSRHVLPLACP